MPDKLTIRIKTESDQTISRFAVDANGQVTIHNDATAQANVSFQATSPLCQGTTPQQSIDINAGRFKTLSVCTGASGEFKYTATVTGAAPEDPILIVERSLGGGPGTNPIFFPESIPYLVGGLVVGLVVGFFIARWRGMRRT